MREERFQENIFRSGPKSLRLKSKSFMVEKLFFIQNELSLLEKFKAEPE